MEKIEIKSKIKLSEEILQMTLDGLNAYMYDMVKNGTFTNEDKTDHSDLYKALIERRTFLEIPK